MNIFEKLQSIFRDIFEDDDLAIRENMTANDIEEWDSLAQINIIVACEKEFKVKFSIQEITSLQNIGDILKLVERKIAQ